MPGNSYWCLLVDSAGGSEFVSIITKKVTRVTEENFDAYSLLSKLGFERRG